MCGILGQLSLDNWLEPDEQKFEKALNLQIHRGPDDYGIYSGETYIFGQRRLSIIDLDRQANQPMLSEDGNVILVFNGEIYNYKELRDDLIKKGYRFRTASDTEVLLYSYYEHGIECLHSFIGMFAFAVHDLRNHKTYIVRDRLGIKPLYFHEGERKFTFSSEIKSILGLCNIERKLNLNAVSSYLSFRYPILDDSFFCGINSLPPGHYIEIAMGEISIREYWNASSKFMEQENDKGEDYYISELKRLLLSSVKYRMIADVPFGAYLSGGVDSSIVTAMMAQETKERIKTFTVGFEEEGFNEFDYARIVATRYNTNHKEIVLSGENYIAEMERLIEYKDAPLSVPNEVPLYLMSRELKKYITVVLSGEGADEIFGGYGRIFRSPFDLERMQKIDTLPISDEEKKQLCAKFISKYGVKAYSSEIDHFLNIYRYTSLNDKKQLLSEKIELDEIEKLLVKKFLRYFDELGNASYYNKLMYVFEKIHLVGLLQRVDAMTMAASVEARVPFVDHRLVEFAFTVPIKYKLKWKSEADKIMANRFTSDEISEKYDIPKYILKKASEEFLPKDILYRKKMGFPVPLNEWFGGQFNDYAKSILLRPEAVNRGLYNIENIEKWLNSDRLSKDHSFAMKIWMLINLELFCEKYLLEVSS